MFNLLLTICIYSSPPVFDPVHPAEADLNQSKVDHLKDLTDIAEKVKDIVDQVKDVDHDHSDLIKEVGVLADDVKDKIDDAKVDNEELHSVHPVEEPAEPIIEDETDYVVMDHTSESNDIPTDVDISVLGVESEHTEAHLEEAEDVWMW